MQILTGSKKGVRCVAFSPDGASLAASGYDGSLRLWNLATGENVRLAKVGITPKSLTWTTDGQRIFWSCGSSGYGSVYSTTITGETRAVIEKVEDVGGICLSPDGCALYVATDLAIQKWGVATGVKLSAWETVSPGFLAVSPDGRILASTHPLSPLAQIDAFHVALWDTATGKQQNRLLECTEYYDGVAFSPDGTRLAALGHESLWLWEFPSGRVMCHHPSRKFYTGLAFSPDSRVLATSNNDGMVRFWDGETGNPVTVFDWDIDKALCVTFSRDGTRAATCSAKGRIVVWDLD